MRLIEQDRADLMSLDSGDVYIAGQQHSMIAIMSEQYSGGQCMSVTKKFM